MLFHFENFQLNNFVYFFLVFRMETLLLPDLDFNIDHFECLMISSMHLSKQDKLLTISQINWSKEKKPLFIPCFMSISNNIHM